MIEEGIRHQADPCRVNRLSESLRRSYCAWSDSDAATRFAKIGGRLYCQHEVSKSGNSSNYQTHRHRHLAQSAINECRQCGADGVTCDRLGDQTQEKEQYQSSNVSRLAPSEVRRPILLRSSGLSKLFHWQYCKIVREKCLEESTTWIGNLIDSVQPQSTSLISVARLFDLHSILPKSERASQPPKTKAAISWKIGQSQAMRMDSEGSVLSDTRKWAAMLLTCSSPYRKRLVL